MPDHYVDEVGCRHQPLNTDMATRWKIKDPKGHTVSGVFKVL